MRKWAVRGAIALALVVLVLATAGWIAARRFQPYVREQSVQYLESRFGTGVELGSLHVAVSFLSPWHPRTAKLRVSGDHLKLPYRDRPDLPPLIVAGKFRVDTELGALWDSPRHIRDIRLESLEINVPPRQPHAASAPQTTAPAAPAPPAVIVDTIHADGIELRIFPADPAKPARIFEIHALTLKGTAAGRPLQYQALLTNPRPPGTIQVAGDFGPWQKDDSGQTPISGAYTFSNADLSAFHAIGGILDSTGRFEGVLRRIEVHGETRTPQFHLSGGNSVPLTTRFDSVVDGTSGDTLLQPVRAMLGASQLEARGRIVRPPGAKARSVVLDVTVRRGRIEDLVRLAVKAPQPFLRGDVDLRTKMEILPAPGRAIAEKLLLDGSFEIEQSQFSGGSVQQKIDMLSRRAQGQPKNEEISDVLSALRGGFLLRDGELRFSELVFQVPGAAIHLRGTYGLDSEQIDMHGVARLQAKVSQTMTGWKRIVLKPVDPLLSKAGAGTLLPIQITGSRAQPRFGLDRGRKPEADSADRQAQ
jgi:hypothetical protein